MILGLDGIRAIAFFLVFAIHTDYLSFGWVGVQLFFVLSGFLITGILLDMKEYLPTKEYFKKFYGRRVLRIFPLYYFYLFAMIGVTTWAISIPYRRNYMAVFQEGAPYALVYIYNFFYASSSFEYTKLLEHFWSLSVEEQFYIFWPVLILLIPKRHLKKLFVGAIFGGLIFRVLFLLIYKTHPLPFIRESMAISLYALPFTHIDAFGFGAYITRFRFPKAKIQLFFLIFALPVFGFASWYLATGTFGEITSIGYPFSMPKAYQYIWGYSVLNYFFALFVYSVVHDKLFVRFLELPWLRYLGKISYGLYVYHFGIIWLTGRIRDVVPMSEAVAKPLIALISLILTIAVASLSFYLIERPLLSYKNRFFPVNKRTAKTFIEDTAPKN